VRPLQAYAARLRQLAAEQPLLLLAHAFTQHLAGLSGGRIIKRLCRRYMALPQDKGARLWEPRKRGSGCHACRPQPPFPIPLHTLPGGKLGGAASGCSPLHPPCPSARPG
jgi:hypothetical protein